MNIPAYPILSVIPLQGQDYLPHILDKIDSAKTRIWASIFIVDARVHKDEFNSVRTLIEKLAYAAWRNVDVRIIVGSATIVDVYVACLTSAYYMKKQGLNVRGFASATNRRKSTHSKYLLFDDNWTIIGSNNWTHESFHEAVNSSLAVESEELNASLSHEFGAVWQTSNEITYES